MQIETLGGYPAIERWETNAGFYAALTDDEDERRLLGVHITTRFRPADFAL